MVYLLIFFSICFQSLVCTDMSGYTRVKSEYSYLVPDSYDFSKKEFLKDGPYAPFDKAILYSWDDEHEYYKCWSAAQNGTADYCQTWSAEEESGVVSATTSSESERGVCNCFENSMGPHYCTYWLCIQQETEVAVTAISDEYSTTYRRSINHDTEYTDCVCRYESLNGKYCQQWWCLETGKDGNTEVEEYNCDEASPRGGEFCLRWRGRIQSNDEKEWSRCKCDRPQQDHCDYWTCFEKEHKRSYLVNFIWLMILSGVSLILLLAYFGYARGKAVEHCTGWMGYFVVIVLGCFVGGFCLLAAGVIGLLAGAGWTLIAIILVCISNMYYHSDDSNDNYQHGGSKSRDVPVSIGYPAPKQEVQMQGTSQGPSTLPSSSAYYQSTV